jgi:hypothetical protein
MAPGASARIDAVHVRYAPSRLCTADVVTLVISDPATSDMPARRFVPESYGILPADWNIPGRLLVCAREWETSRVRVGNRLMRLRRLATNAPSVDSVMRSTPRADEKVS